MATSPTAPDQTNVQSGKGLRGTKPHHARIAHPWLWLFLLAQLCLAIPTRAQDTLQVVKDHQRIDPIAAWYRGGVLPDTAGLGTDVAGMGDIDRDGVPDIAIGLGADTSAIAYSAGTVVVCFLNADGTVKSSKRITSYTDSLNVKMDVNDRFGARIANIGDLNGDGMTDMAVLSPGDDDGGADRGAVYILFLDTTAKVIKYQKISDTVGGFTGTMTNNNGFAAAIAEVGDMNADGIQDIAVGAYLSNDGGSGRGALWVLLMNTNGTAKGYHKYSASSTWPGSNPLNTNGANFGFSVAKLGDLDGDGKNDLAVTARIQGGKGYVYVLFLNGDGTIKAYQRIGPPSYGGLTTSISAGGGHFGWSIDNVGDLNSDGTIDLAFGLSHQDDGYTYAGAVLIGYLNPNGTLQYEEIISQTSGTGGGALGLSTDAWFGFGVSAIGDLDGDHVMDLAVSTPNIQGPGSQPNMGAVFLLELHAKPLRVMNTMITDATLSSPGKADLDIKGGVRPYRFVWMDTIPTPGRLNAWKSSIDTSGFSAMGMGQVLPDDITEATLIELHEQDTSAMRSGIHPLVVVDAADTVRYRTIHVGEALVQSTLTGATLSGKDLTKTGSTGWNTMWYTTKNRVPAGEDGWVSFIAPSVTKRIAVGFSVADTTQINGYQQLSAGFYLSNDSIRTWDGGSLHYVGRKFKAGEQFRVERRADSVLFYHERVLLRTVAATFMGRDQWVDCSIYQNGAQIKQLAVSVPATFHVVADIGHLPALTPNGGSVDLTVTPAIGTYSYDWLDGPATTQDRASLSPGRYEVDITSSSYAHTRRKTLTVGNQVYWESGYSFIRDSITGEGTDLERSMGPDAWTSCTSINSTEDRNGHWISARATSSHGGGTLLAWSNTTDTVVHAAWWTYELGRSVVATALIDGEVVGRAIVDPRSRLAISGQGADTVSFLVDGTDLYSVHAPAWSGRLNVLAGLRSPDDRIDELATSFPTPLVVNTTTLIPGLSYSIQAPGQTPITALSGTSFVLDLGSGPRTGDHEISVAANDSTDAMELLFELDQGGVANMRIILNDTTYSMDSTLYDLVPPNELVLLDGPKYSIGSAFVPFYLGLSDGMSMTPDGDDHDDVFRVAGFPPEIAYELVIKDPEDNVLFESDDPMEGWNGKYMNTGSEAEAGPYLFLLTLDGNEYSGQFLLERPEP